MTMNGEARVRLYRAMDAAWVSLAAFAKAIEATGLERADIVRELDRLRGSSQVGPFSRALTFEASTVALDAFTDYLGTAFPGASAKPRPRGEARTRERDEPR